MSTTPVNGSALAAEDRGAILGFADDALVLGHRLSEWCGHGPMLEEDLALANIALDCLGQASLLYEIVCGGDKVEVDRLVFFRDAEDYRNVIITELPNGDFAHTMLRQLFVDSHRLLLFEALSASPVEQVSAVARKTAVEIRYDLRHASAWVVRLGRGTAESSTLLQSAMETLAPYLGELVEPWPDILPGGVPPVAESTWRGRVATVLDEAGLALPPLERLAGADGRHGRHTEHLDHLLSEMQSVARAHPGARW